MVLLIVIAWIGAAAGVAWKLIDAGHWVAGMAVFLIAACGITVKGGE